MKFDAPALTPPADEAAPWSLLGQPLPRVEGPLKVSGQAPYAYERHDVAEGQLVGYPLCAGIAKGRIAAMELAAARAAPGVVAVLATVDRPALPRDERNVALLFGGRDIHHYHQAIALVVAESFEQARAAAALIEVIYEPAEAAVDLARAHEALMAKQAEPAAAAGDFEAAYAAAAITLDRTYTTPGQSHAMMEPHASIAAWDGERLTLWTSNQMIAWTVEALATTLSLPKERIRVDSPYIGGGFGGKLFLRADAVLAALAAREIGRPVKVALPRPLVCNNTTHRPATLQRIRMAATAEGRILALAHECTSGNLPGGEEEKATQQSKVFYAGENRLLIQRLAELDLPEGNAMRAPGEASGLMALEIAMDEMAEKLGLDPVAFRALNDTQVDPTQPERRFSQRRFLECLDVGARAFGWSARDPVPGRRREGEWLIGLGMAGGYRGAPAMDSGARVRLEADGRLVVETDMTDIGTGSYTILAQTAAETLGLPLERIEVRLGDSTFPVSAGSGGQWGACSATAGVRAACLKLRDAIGERLGRDPATLRFLAEGLQAGNALVPLADLLAAGPLEAEATLAFGAFREDYVVATFAAHFCEVAVRAATGEARVRRMLAVCDAGRILNPMTARSQVIGAMTMGLGAALTEELVVDRPRGLFINHDLASYEVPVHADVPAQEVIFLEGGDPVAGPLQAKGVAELGICGVGAAVANAIYNATGIRVRDYPITLDKLLANLPTL